MGLLGDELLYWSSGGRAGNVWPFRANNGKTETLLRVQNLFQPTEAADSSASDKAENDFDYLFSDEESSGYKNRIKGYIQQLRASEEGRRVFDEAQIRQIYSSSAFNSYTHSDGTIEFNPTLLAYTMFCHEVRHAWQFQTGNFVEDGEDEQDANLWAAGRAAEAGHLCGSVASVLITPFWR